MNTPESFIPLTAASAPAAPREFRVAILNGHNHAHNGANDANGGGAVVPAAGFQMMETLRPAAAGPAAPDLKLKEPRVTVQREGDRVTHLRIQCTCGMIMDLACVYDAPAAGKS